MITRKQFTDQIVANVRKAQQGQVFCDDIFVDSEDGVGKNEFLFFIKPEITLPSAKVMLPEILHLIYNKMQAYGLSIRRARILSAAYLDQYNIVAQHYGVINALSSNALENMSLSAKEKFHAVYGCRVEDVTVLGGLEFLDQYSAYDAWSLGELWQGGEFVKLSGGTYCTKLSHDNEIIYLVNGFHPKQLKHFTDKNRSIVAMSLYGDTSWRVARNDFIGATMPASAIPGSLRREFLDRKDALGLEVVSPSINGVHLSAGPIEALVELRRFMSDYSNQDKILSWSDIPFGRGLLDRFSPDVVDLITSNAGLIVDGATVPVFDLTEEMESDEAVELLSGYFDK